MISWIQTNFATIVISLLLILIVTSILFSLIRDRKRGKSSCASCGGGCDGCAGCSHSRGRV